MAAMFVNGPGLMSNLYKGHSIDASYQFLVHLAKWFQRRRFLDIDQPETRMTYTYEGSQYVSVAYISMNIRLRNFTSIF
jgi:hypothetical protein